MSSSSESDDGSRNKHKGFKISSSGTSVRWDGEDWTLYKHAVVNAFEQSLLDGIADDTEKEDPAWPEEKKGKLKKKQAKIKILIQGSLTKRLAKQVMSKKTYTEMWQELVTIYEGKSNPAQKATHLKGKDDVLSGNKSNQKSKPNKDSKPKTVRTDIECFKCGGNRFKSDCPELVGEEKPSARENLQANKRDLPARVQSW
ncbi:hypothetical protein PHMEG_00017026 [Phytophthora megakarya]|uniref:Uncharacterized protein n=1 Tax=Phytophthora megakarya TaxID=4795 RepID=A0A225VZ35_9STRA|nr:hypothetical protein PHMEG_00017026 [Phytophthora megakarya]